MLTVAQVQSARMAGNGTDALATTTITIIITRKRGGSG